MSSRGKGEGRREEEGETRRDVVFLFADSCRFERFISLHSSSKVRFFFLLSPLEKSSRAQRENSIGLTFTFLLPLFPSVLV